MSGSLIQGEITNLLVAYLPTAAQDVVAVYDNEFNQLFPDARPVKATVKPIAKLMEHPVESGSVITDYRVILPLSLDVTFVLTPETYFDTYQQIGQAYVGNTTIQVQTKTNLYTSLLIEKMPHDEVPDKFDTIAITVSFKEVIFVKVQTSALFDAAKNGGNKTAKIASPTQTTDANKKAEDSSALHSLIFGKGEH